MATLSVELNDREIALAGVIISEGMIGLLAHPAFMDFSFVATKLATGLIKIMQEGTRKQEIVARLIEVGTAIEATVPNALKKPDGYGGTITPEWVTASVQIQQIQAARIRYLQGRLLTMGDQDEIDGWLQFVTEHPFPAEQNVPREYGL